MSAPPPISSVLGKYRLLAKLGSGGMADVFLAVARGPQGFSKLVVVKVLRPNLAGEADILEMFLDEARLSAQLSHPNVVQTYEVGEEGHVYFLVMEYLEGETFTHTLDRSRKVRAMPLGLSLRVVIDALSGLHYCHELTDFTGRSLELVHRDVSPQNVFVTFDGVVKMLDFGIAKALTSSAETRTGVLKGKVRYMAPEQFSGSAVDRRADLYAVGVMLWDLAAGQKLWKGRGDIEIMHRVITSPIPSPRELNPHVHSGLERVCMRALAQNRSQRYSTALELQGDLERVLETLEGPSSPRELGRFVATIFGDLRTERKRGIEQQMTRIAATATSELRTIDPNVLPELSRATAIPPSLTPPPPESVIVAPDGSSAQPASARGQHQTEPEPSNTALRSGLISSAAAPPLTTPAKLRGLAVPFVAGGLLSFALVFWLRTRALEPRVPVPEPTVFQDVPATAPPAAEPLPPPVSTPMPPASNAPPDATLPKDHRKVGKLKKPLP